MDESGLRCEQDGAFLLQLIPGKLYCPECHRRKMNARGLGNYPSENERHDDGDTGVDAETWPAYADFRYYTGPGRVAPAPAPRGDPQRVELEVPKGDRLDHQPTASEVLDTIRAGLGDAEVIEVRKHLTYRNSYGREIDLETCTPAALHGAAIDLRYGNGKRKRKAKPEGEQ